MRAVEDVNAMSPQPDFVLYGGDLAQLGRHVRPFLLVQLVVVNIIQGLRAINERLKYQHLRPASAIARHDIETRDAML